MSRSIIGLYSPVIIRPSRMINDTTKYKNLEFKNFWKVQVWWITTITDPIWKFQTQACRGYRTYEAQSSLFNQRRFILQLLWPVYCFSSLLQNILQTFKVLSENLITKKFYILFYLSKDQWTVNVGRRTCFYDK